MKPLLLSLVLALGLPGWAVADDWRGVFSSDLRRTEHELISARAELAALGNPVVGNTVPQFGYQELQRPAPPPESPWVQVDLGASQRLDSVALVPVLVDFQPVERKAYGFPRRFRVDLSDEASFATFTPLLVHTEEDFPSPGAAPVVIPAAGRSARFIRVTVTREPEENGTFFFALAELMVMQGNRNIALGGAVTAASSVNIQPRWNTAFLTDGRTPLGPPIRHGVMPKFDALFAAVGADGSPAWMVVDLGEEMSVDEVRLHPEHARQGADVPGFRFPAQFRVELASDPDFAESHLLFDTAGKDYPNPGNNPVTISAAGKRGRYVRVLMVKGEIPTADVFALSELEVQAGGHIASLGCRVTSSGDPKRNPPRPLQDLTDGYTSYGKLMELPQWLEEWARRSALQANIRQLEAALPAQLALAERRAEWTALAALLTVGTGMVVLSLRTRSLRRREQERFRTQLAQDLHDEIGSNLAGIARLSETAAQADDGSADDLREIHRIAHETNDAMREVLWLVGARQEMGIELGAQMQTAAARLLPGRTIRWKHPPHTLPPSWNTDTRRQMFLFFKEALTNVVRHARATEVELSAQIVDGTFELLICDNGRGFDVAGAPVGLGLGSLRARAAALRAAFSIDSAPGAGTRVRLSVPISSR